MYIIKVKAEPEIGNDCKIKQQVERLEKQILNLISMYNFVELSELRSVPEYIYTKQRFKGNKIATEKEEFKKKLRLIQDNYLRGAKIWEFLRVFHPLSQVHKTAECPYKPE